MDSETSETEHEPDSRKRSEIDDKASRESGKSQKRKERLKKLQEERDKRIAAHLDHHSQSTWGWKGTAKLDVEAMSGDITVSKRRSASQYGTAPLSSNDYSILHKGTGFRDSKSGRESQTGRESQSSRESQSARESQSGLEARSSVPSKIKDVPKKSTRRWFWQKEDKEPEKPAEEVKKEDDKKEVPSELPSRHSSIIPSPEPGPPPKKIPPPPAKPSAPPPPPPPPPPPRTSVPIQKQPGVLKDGTKKKSSTGSVKFFTGPSKPDKKPAPPPAPKSPVSQPPQKPAPPPPPKSPVPPPPQKPAPPPPPKSPVPPPPQKPAPQPKRSSPAPQPPPKAQQQVKPPPSSKPISQPPPPPRRTSESFGGLTRTLSTTAVSDAGSGSSYTSIESHPDRPRKHRKPRKPKPSDFATDFDMDDELSTSLSDETSMLSSDKSSVRKTARSRSLSIFEDGKPKVPDDELLYSLTAKEELVYRKSLSEMRWEEEESISEETPGYTTESSEAEAAALLWERVGAGKRFAIPVISVNDRRISLGHLEPDENDDHSPDDDSERTSRYKSIFDDATAEGLVHDEKDPVQVIFDLIDEAKENKKERDYEEDKKAAARAKLWRKRLIVVVLLNFVMKFRRRFVTFCEIFVPIIVCGVVVSGMITNSDGTMQSLQAKIFDSEAEKGIFDPFEKIGTEVIFTAFCSNEEYCGKRSKRNYYIVYAPSNKFTDDLMQRSLKIIGLDAPPLTAAQPHPNDQINSNFMHEDLASKLIGVNSSFEVERICRNHWQKVSKFAEEKDNDASDSYEREINVLKKESKLVRYPIGVIFSMEGGLVGEKRKRRIENDEELPKTLTYTFRTFYSEVANTVEGFPFKEQSAGKSHGRGQGHRHFQSTPYLHTGIIGMQMALDLAFAEKIVEKAEKVDPDMEIDNTKVSRAAFLRAYKTEPTLKQFEYPTYKGFVLRVRGWVALTISIIFSYLVGDILVAQDVVHEQNRGSIELLKIHGMTTSIRWIANLILHGLFRGITTLMMALIIHYEFAADAVAKFSSPLFLWLFLWMHACTVTCFNYFITTGIGVKKPELAGLFVVCLSFVTFLTPLHLFVEDYLNRFSNIALCFFLPQWNLANGIYYYLRYEMYEEGLDWYDFPVVMDTETHLIIALPLSCNIFLYSTLFYLSLTIYTDHILRRDFSPKEGWLFFLRSFTRPPPSETKATRPIPRNQKPSVYEAGPREAPYGPRFRNVTITDAASKLTVLDNISLDIYEGEVTCIVGQIGSGKSDFLNVIAGVNTPSAGFVDVKGLKVHEYHDITNRYVSLCPQQQLLIETLSVEDHIRLCCMLHGVSYAKAKTQATFLLKMFGLMPMRRHSYKGITSGDIKKLMLAMALSKSPSVLLLDNPIDQLDSESRFQFWRLLQELKPMRSIIVTCTTLEEAQLYGDRIAVLSKGKLVCYGSPMYLRLAYGIGNVLTLKMMEGFQPDIPAIQDLMHKELMGAKTTHLETKGVSLQVDAVKFILPFGKFYGGLLERIEDNMERFGISKIAMSQPSLWALFHKISSHPGIEQVLAKREIRMLRGGNPDEHEDFGKAVETPIPVMTEVPHQGIFHQMHILIHKKIWYYRQKYAMFLVAYLPQILLLMLVVYFSRLFLLHQPESLSKTVSTRMYANNLILVRSADNEHTRKGWQEAYHKVLREDDKKSDIHHIDYRDDLEAYLAQGMAHTLTHYKKQTIVAFSRDKKGQIGYYSSNSIHAAPIASHIMMQAMLYLISPDRNQPYATILVTHPFIQYPGFPAGSTQSNSSTILGLFLSIILCLMSAPVLRMILTERASNFKAIQRMSGVSGSVYWFSHGVADHLLYILLSMLCWGLMIFIDNIGFQQFNGWEERLALIILLSCWLCWAALPYTYLVGCLIPKFLTGYGHYVLYHFMLGIVPKVVTYQFLRLHVRGLYRFLRFILYVFPPYALTSACVHFFHVVGDERWCRNSDPVPCQMYENVTKLLRNRSHGIDEVFGANNNISDSAGHYLSDKIVFDDKFRTCCKAYCEEAGTCHEEIPFFNLNENDETVIPNLKHDVIALFSNGLVFWVLIILYEQRLIHGVLGFISTKVCGNLERTVAQRDVKTSDEPEDVKQEHQKVDYMVEIEGDVDSEVYLVQDVTKFYKYTKGLDHIYFSVPVNTVTGLLGLPKSGKSTILDILTCQLTPSAGYVYKDNDLLEGANKRKLMMRVGYCPQRPCVLSYLTGAQMLSVLGRLRGLSRTECEKHVLWWVQLFELQDVANKKCSTYRKGQQQRLCCALALIGDTNMVIFDESTSNMDKLEQYTFWNIISRIPRYMPRTVLFATIDADEVQHQSSKALLMESGSLVAVGQLTDIFKNNNQGMTLALRYGVSAIRKLTEFQKKTKIDKLKDHVIQYLSPCALIDEQENLLVYHLKDQNLQLSRVYAVMEGAKVRFTTILEHFQVYEPSLDDIILQFHKARLKRLEKLAAAAEEKESMALGITKDKEPRKLSM